MNPTIPLAGLLWHTETRVDRAVRATTLILAGTAVLAVSAKTQIPFVPIPFTMQTAVVLAIGLTYGPVLGSMTVAAYLAEGAAGMPVFAAGGGPVYLTTSPTAGYLWGMLLAAALMGVLVRRGWDTSVPRTLGAMLAGTVVIFGVGVTWLGYQVGLQTAIASGVRPFLVSETLKIAIVALALPAARRATQKAMADST